MRLRKPKTRRLTDEEFKNKAEATTDILNSLKVKEEPKAGTKIEESINVKPIEEPKAGKKLKDGTVQGKISIEESNKVKVGKEEPKSVKKVAESILPKTKKDSMHPPKTIVQTNIVPEEPIRKVSEDIKVLPKSNPPKTPPKRNSGLGVIIFISLLLVVLLGVLLTYAQSVDRLEDLQKVESTLTKKEDELKGKIAELEKQKSELGNNYEANKNKNVNLDKEISKLSKEIDKLQAELDSYD